MNHRHEHDCCCSKNDLCREFKHYEGQPVRIFTDDGRRHRGVVMEAFQHSVRIIDKCGDTFLIEYCKIDAVQEPRMHLGPCRCEKDCEEEEHKHHHEEHRHPKHRNHHN